MLPVLTASATSEVRLSDLVDRLGEEFHLTDDEMQQLLPSGKQTALANRTGWAKFHLAKAGLVRTTRRGYFEATERGRGVLAQNPKRIDLGFLSQFPEFAEFIKAGQSGTRLLNKATEIVKDSSPTPDELLRETHLEI